MAFKAILIIDGEVCDRCNGDVTEENPAIHFCEMTRMYGRHLIVLHISCIQKIVKRLQPGEQPQEAEGK